MSDFIALLKENVIELLSIFLVAITSYRVAAYNATKPNKLNIKQKQFDSLYLPLYKYLDQHYNKSISKAEAAVMSSRIRNLLMKNYELAFPSLHNLNCQLITSIKEDERYQKNLDLIYEQVSYEYELLKKVLGYPSLNTWQLLKRMSTKQKCEMMTDASSPIRLLILWLMNIFAGFLCVAVLLSNSAEITPDVKTFFLVLICIFVLFLILFLIQYIRRR